jgi:hypothetical protein
VRYKSLGLITLLAAVTACSGGTTMPSTVGGAPRDATQKAEAKLEIRLKIPRRRRARYISPSTKSLKILEGKSKLGTFDTTPSSKYCVLSGGDTLCQFTVGAAPGKNRTFTIDTYDGTGAKGNLLSTGQVTKTIVTAGPNLIAITLNGVVASIEVALVRPNPPAGSSTTVGVTVMAKDADGNIILGPGRYSAPITLTDSDASGITALSSATVTSPAQAITLTYSGGSLTSASIGASATGVVPSNVTPGSFTPMPTVVGNFVLPNSFGSDTNASVWPVAIAKAPDGTLWVSINDNSGNHGLMTLTNDGTFTSYVPGSGAAASLPNDQINGLAPSPAGGNGVVYASNNYIGGQTVDGTNSGAVSISSITGACAGAFGERIITYGSTPSTSGAWMSVGCSSGSQVLNAPAGGGGPQFSNLPSNFINPQGLVLGKDGKLYVAGEDSNTHQAAIEQLSISGQTATPVATLDVANAGTNLDGLAVDPSGTLWATTLNSCDQSYIVRVSIGAAFASSSVTLIPTNAGCSSPGFLTALADGSLWVPMVGEPDAEQIVPSSTGGAPQVLDIPLPSPYSVYGDMWDVAVGSDGCLYITNDDNGNAGFSSNVVKVAY